VLQLSSLRLRCERKQRSDAPAVLPFFFFEIVVLLLVVEIILRFYSKKKIILRFCLRRRIDKRDRSGFGEGRASAGCVEVFSFLYFLKIKISKMYVRFQIFQKYTPVALP